MKSIVALLAMAPNRTTATIWANELEKNGFAHHSAEEIRKSLQVSTFMRGNAIGSCSVQEVHDQQLPIGESESLDTPGSETFSRPPQSVTASSYDGSQHDEG
jgi:hypothetical protein